MALRRHMKFVDRPRYVTAGTRAVELPTRDEASFCAMLILVLDVVILSILFVRILILKKDFDMLTLIGILEIIVITTLIVSFMLKIVSVELFRVLILRV